MEMNGSRTYSFHVPDTHNKDTTCSQESLFPSLCSSLENEKKPWYHSMNPRTTILLSLLYLALLSFFGSAVLLAGMHHHNQQTQNVHGFLTVLMLTSITWMLWFGYKSAKNKNIKMYQDHQAGASWLKGGLCLFALATLVLDSLTLGYYHELYQCTSVIATSFPIVQAVFTVIQVSLLSFYAKVCIQEQQHLNRFGLMHTLATNILMWMSVVLDESLKQLEEMYDIHKESVSIVPGSGIPTNSCVCHADLCQIFSEGAAYLHPFNIEFSLFSSTMLYVIWKNTGKKPCSMKISGHRTRGFHINGAFVGLILGAFAISATFGVMISFGVLAKSPGTVPEALRIYYLFNSVLLSAIFVASLIGVITCRLQKHPFFDDKTKSVVRSLDITLLVGSSCGPLMVSVFSLVAIFFLHIEGNLYALDFCFSLCKTIQILGQNLFITEALYIGPSVSKCDTKEQIFSISQETADEIIDYGVKNLSKKGESRGPFLKPNTSAQNSQHSVDLNKAVPKNLQNGSSMKDASNTRESFKEEVKEHLFSTRRKILQNISILLICYNISVWILYAYGTRPHLVSKIEQSFYGFTLWVIIVKISLPLGIFYRMHSVASLFEAYCNICAAAC